MTVTKTDETRDEEEKVAGGAERQRAADRDRKPRSLSKTPGVGLVVSDKVRADDEHDREGHPSDTCGVADSGERRADPGDPETLSAAQAARLRKRLAAAVQLAKRAGTEGEKAAAMAAAMRIADRLGEELAPYLEEKQTGPAFDFDAYARRRRAYTRHSETTFEAWVRIVETDPVFVDIFAGWAQRARACGWHENAVQAAQDYAAEYGVSPDEVDLGM